MSYMSMVPDIFRLIPKFPSRFPRIPDDPFGPFGPFLARWREEEEKWPSIEMTSDEKAYEVKVEVAGVAPDDVKLSVHDGMLVVSGEKKEQKEDKKTHVSEWRYGSFERAVNIPDDADADAISAKCKDGVLTVTMPRTKGKCAGKAIPIAKG